MKKLLIFILMFLILISGAKTQETFTLLDYFSGEYYAYTSTPASANYINLGSCVMNIGAVNENVPIIGESLTIQNFEPLSALEVLNAKLIKIEQLDTGATIFYAYTDKINKNVTIENQKVNIQIATYSDYSVIGWPLILGSY